MSERVQELGSSGKRKLKSGEIIFQLLVEVAKFDVNDENSSFSR